LVLSSPFGGANVVNGGKYLKTASNFSDTYHQVLKQGVLV
jgi:hypothetical protein